MTYIHIDWPSPRYADSWFGLKRGRMLKRVFSNPKRGEYSFDEVTGNYTFSSEDAGRDIEVSGLPIREQAAS